jgi:hypothetical protein
MKILINCVFAVGIGTFLLGASLTAKFLFSDQEIVAADFAIMFMGAVTTLVAYFVRLRVINGIRVLEISQEDKKEIQDLRRELAPRAVAGRLLINFGGLFVFAGILLVLNGLNSGSSFRRGVAADILLFGAGITGLLLGVWLTKGNRKG